ncbi:histamine N-methyltransferase-like [Gambusia affinis]|uniref:histamine N-methyltransferase-like n=1 Tax=Gambusia affinis TaxID=33528 RepID=UPI001CDC7CDC|nr:histamine N-methyltransferase-like [Gambusia affinis]XP_043987246.1 histamine N-methyltransferase-like [Gambusia affinis]
MSAETHTCYEGCNVNIFPFYLEKSGEHAAIVKCLQNVLPAEFQRIGAGKSSLDVLGVGSGGGEKDVQILSLLQSAFPSVPITADIVEGSSELTANFKALATKTADLKKIQFSWHIMSSEDYEKAKGGIKKFDFIHMIQMIYYVNGRLMIIVESANSGWDILWKTYKKELCVGSITEYRSSGEIISCLKDQSLKFEEHLVPNSFDITECFDPSSVTGERLLSFMTGTEHFYKSFSPEVRAGILDILRNKCSTEKDGRVFFNSNLTCIFVHA